MKKLLSRNLKFARALSCSPHTARPGVSLLELLVSIFVLTVGLLGVAALLPLGNREVVRASISHRGAAMGQAAFRDLRLRGFTRPEMWIAADGRSLVVEEKGEDFGRLIEEFRRVPFVLDPLTIAAVPDATVVGRFPLGSSPSTVPRISIRNQLHGVKLNKSLAQQFFVSNDNLLVVQPDPEKDANIKFNVEGMKIQRMIGGDSKRQTESLFSWMATFVPSPVDPTIYQVSVVVFYRDMPNFADQQPRQEFTLPNVQMLGAGISGGTIRLTGSPEVLKKTKADRWMMLIGGQQQSGTFQMKWYKITGATGSVSDESSERIISIAGPDWDVVQNANPTAVIFNNVVAVFEKTIQIEGPTLWAPR